MKNFLVGLAALVGVALCVCAAVTFIAHEQGFPHRASAVVFIAAAAVIYTHFTLGRDLRKEDMSLMWAYGRNLERILALANLVNTLHFKIEELQKQQKGDLNAEDQD